MGVEYAGITVSKSVAKWFKGKEMALAMGMQVAIARVGSFAPLAFGAKIANTYDVPTTILIVVVFLILGLLGFFYYNTLDKKLETQIEEEANSSGEDQFKLSDLLVSNGILYFSFREDKGAEIRSEGRSFFYYSIEEMLDNIQKTNCFSVLDIWDGQTTKGTIHRDNRIKIWKHLLLKKND